ncbi:hypothetical protein [Haloactinomyces albus]|uniref:Uncharacterized protein n=1 Tax=Haloactinomyces albus TaxID=1352928 RepID=A0AAE4CRZ9_9ACTN|nr:hypothetical protein [Haloactinomyces albus]MDR7304213.1 hypothetical protein [Haloactinomyces albus]
MSTTDDELPARLLVGARAVLEGTTSIPRHRAPRAAAFLGRQALEDITRALCRAENTPADAATMRTRLILLRARMSSSVAENLQAAWYGLSRACHHHAFELSPTETEIRRLVELVASLDPRSGSSPEQLV